MSPIIPQVHVKKIHHYTDKMYEKTDRKKIIITATRPESIKDTIPPCFGKYTHIWYTYYVHIHSLLTHWSPVWCTTYLTYNTTTTSAQKNCQKKHKEQQPEMITLLFNKGKSWDWMALVTNNTPTYMSLSITLMCINVINHILLPTAFLNTYWHSM